MLVADMEEVTHVSDFVASYAQKVPVWLRHVVEKFISINHKVFPYFIESLCGDVGREIIRKQEISRKGVFELCFPPQEFVHVVTH